MGPGSAYTYEDLRLTFEPAPGEHVYRVLAIDFATGVHADGTFALSRDDEYRIRTTARTMRDTSRDVGGPREFSADAEDIGGRLANALLNGPVGSLYHAAHKRVLGTPGQGLRVSLSLGHAPALLDVPWELLFVRPRFVASQRRTPIVRLLETSAPTAAARVDDHLNVLGVIASPRGFPSLDVNSERSLVDEATAAVRQQGLAHFEWLQPATPQALRRSLRDGTYHIIHFVGHSDFTADGRGVILLEGEDGAAVEVGETVLANLVDDQSANLRLVVLNSCKGARSRAEDPQAGVAATLMSLGLPAVVAMQFSISDKAAIAFAGEFYTNLIGRREPVDSAVSEARKAILSEVSQVEWATPVLFLRDPDAALFTFPPASPFPPPTRPQPQSNLPTDDQQANITVTNSGPVAIGGNVTITGTNIVGRDAGVDRNDKRRRRRR
jgi:CHAT domain